MLRVFPSPTIHKQCLQQLSPFGLPTKEDVVGDPERGRRHELLLPSPCESNVRTVEIG